MKRHGNGGQCSKSRYWMCHRCLTQWERRPLRDHGDGPLLDEDVMGFGKYGHLTYTQVYLSDPAYVNWCVMTMQHSVDDVGLCRFARYCIARQQQGAFPDIQDCSLISVGGLPSAGYLPPLPTPAQSCQTHRITSEDESMMENDDEWQMAQTQAHTALQVQESWNLARQAQESYDQAQAARLRHAQLAQGIAVDDSDL